MDRALTQRLFELDPRLQTLFRGDMVLQGKRLMAMIEAVVRGLRGGAAEAGGALEQDGPGAPGGGEQWWSG